MTSERLVFVDLETAESSGVWSVIQVAAVAVSNRLRELGCFEAKVRTTNPVHHAQHDPAVWEREAQPTLAIAERFGAFLREHATQEVIPRRGRSYRVAQIVAHNAEFDGAMLKAWFRQCEMFFPGHFRMLCTVQRAGWLFRENGRLTPPGDYKLGTLCQYFGVPYRPEEAHDALYDARATVELYRALSAVSASPESGRSGRARRSGGTDRTADRRATGVGDTPLVWSSGHDPKPMPRMRSARFRGATARRP